MEARVIARAAKRIRLTPISLHQLAVRHSSTKAEQIIKPSTEQAIPVGDYYSWILESDTTTIPPKTSAASPIALTPPAISATKNFDTKPVTASNPDANILFTSRTVKLRERAEDISRKSTMVAGVWIPPKPDEPDDCCMSGCVNCVWDRYQDEMQEYLGAKKLAEAAMSAVGSGKGKETQLDGAPPATSMDDDGGGSESNWTSTGKGNDEEDPFKGVPVGIREFMRLERNLKERTKAL